MKTFEERYTAWIDGELEGNALVAFEQELARRATVEEAAADKADAMRLNAFLQDHLKAPVLTNADFFNHQLRERIAGERAATQRPPSERAARVPLFAWTFSRLVTLGAACLFIGGALYYGMIPKDNSTATPQVALGTHSGANPAKGTDAVAANGVTQDNSVSPAGLPAASNDPVLVAKLTKEQQERQQRQDDLIWYQAEQQHIREVVEPGVDIQAKVPDQTVTTTATPLHYKDFNVNVLWVNGLDYLPDVSGLDSGNAGSPVSAISPAPAVTATP